MLARPLLKDADPRIRATAAVALAGSSSPDDVNAAEAALVELLDDARDAARAARRDVAAALREINEPPVPAPADSAALRLGAGRGRRGDGERAASPGRQISSSYPTLVALLRHRHLKGRARSVLVSYGEPVVDALAHFMRDPDEDPWIRRHIPATLAQIPSQKTVDVLVCDARRTRRLPALQGGHRAQIGSGKATRRSRSRVSLSKRSRSTSRAGFSTTCRCTTTCIGAASSTRRRSSRSPSCRRCSARVSASTGCWR